MSEENKALVRRFYEEVAIKGNLLLADELVAEDFIDHDRPGPDVVHGREGLKQVFANGREAFSDLTITIQDQVAEGDKVVTRLTFNGPHTSDYRGLPATGKSISVGAVDIFRLEGGKITERWGKSDTMGMMQQLGVMRPPGES